MWAHYTCSHEGFCLGFDAWAMGLLLPKLWKSGQKIALKRVNYSRTMPIVDMMKIQTDIDVFQTFVMTKSIDWEYEKEWRLLGFGGPYDIKIPPEVLTTVYLGCRIKETTKSELLEIIKSRQVPVQVFQASPRADEFNLVFNPVAL